MLNQGFEEGYINHRKITFIGYLSCQAEFRTFTFPTPTATGHITSTAYISMTNKNAIITVFKTQGHIVQIRVQAKSKVQITLTCHYKVLVSGASMKHMVHCRKQKSINITTMGGRLNT